MALFYLSSTIFIIKIKPLLCYKKNLITKITVENINYSIYHKFATINIIFTLAYATRSVYIVACSVYIVEERNFESKGSNYQKLQFKTSQKNRIFTTTHFWLLYLLFYMPIYSNNINYSFYDTYLYYSKIISTVHG